MLDPAQALITTLPAPGGDNKLRLYRTDGTDWSSVPTNLTGAAETEEEFAGGSAVAVSPNGRYIAAAVRYTSNHAEHPDGLGVVVHDTNTWGELGRFVVPTISEVNGIAVSDAGLVAVSSTKNFPGGVFGVLVCDPQDADPAGSAQLVEVPSAPPSGAGVFMPGGTFGVPTYAGFPVFTVGDWEPAASPVIASTGSGDIALRSGDGSVVFIIKGSGAECFNWATGSGVTLPAAASGAVYATVSSDGNKLYYGTGGEDVSMMNVVGETDGIVLTITDKTVVGASLSPDDSKLAVVVYDGSAVTQTIQIYDTTTWGLEMTVDAVDQSSAGWHALKAITLVWTPTPSLKPITGTVYGSDGLPAERDVQVLSREPNGFSVWTTSNENGEYTVYLAVGTGQVNRIVYDNTGSLNDLIDRIEL